LPSRPDGRCRFDSLRSEPDAQLLGGIVSTSTRLPFLRRANRPLVVTLDRLSRCSERKVAPTICHVRRFRTVRLQEVEVQLLVGTKHFVFGVPALKQTPSIPSEAGHQRRTPSQLQNGFEKRRRITWRPHTRHVSLRSQLPLAADTGRDDRLV